MQPRGLRDQFADSFRELAIPPGILRWLQESVKDSDLTEQAARDREVKRLEEQTRRTEAKLEAMYDDRLEGRITPEMYDRRAKDVKSQLQTLVNQLETIKTSQPAPVDQAINLMGLTSRAADLFLLQPAHQQQAFLKLMVKSATWQGRQLQTEFESPFETLRRSNG